MATKKTAKKAEPIETPAPKPSAKQAIAAVFKDMAGDRKLSVYEVEIDHNIPTIPPDGDRPRKLLHLAAYTSQEAGQRVTDAGWSVMGVEKVRDCYPHEVTAYTAKREAERHA